MSSFGNYIQTLPRKLVEFFRSKEVTLLHLRLVQAITLVSILLSIATIILEFHIKSRKKFHNDNNRAKIENPNVHQ